MTIRNLSHIDKNQVKKIEHSDNKVSNVSTAKAEQAKDTLNTDSLALSNVSKDEFDFAKVELSKLNRVTMEQLSDYREMIQEYDADHYIQKVESLLGELNKNQKEINTLKA